MSYSIRLPSWEEGAVTGLELIVGALAAGSAAGISNAASSAISDAYATLKSLVVQRLTGKSEARALLEAQESSPDAWYAQLSADLNAVGADSDEAILSAARHLWTLLVATDSRSVDLRMAKGVQVGSRNIQTNNFF